MWRFLQVVLGVTFLFFTAVEVIVPMLTHIVAGIFGLDEGLDYFWFTKDTFNLREEEDLSELLDELDEQDL